MPHLFAILLCVLILFALVGLVIMEYQRSRKGPRLGSAAFLRENEALRKSLYRASTR